MDIKHGLTRKQFIELLTSLAPDIVQSCLKGKMALPEMAKQVAMWCFVYRSEWCEGGQRTLRNYMRNLHNYGIFGFDDE